MAIPTLDIFHFKDHPTDQALRVLLVDDSYLQQRTLELLLLQLGHSVTAVSDGCEALAAILQDRSYDVVLMDCQMPYMDGFQATRVMRKIEDKTGQRLGIVGISATASRTKCFTAGMDDFLPKPIGKPMLKAVLGRWSRSKLAGIKMSLPTGV